MYDWCDCDDGLSGGQIAGIVIGSVVAAALLLGLLAWCSKRKAGSGSASHQQQYQYQQPVAINQSPTERAVITEMNKGSVSASNQYSGIQTHNAAPHPQTTIHQYQAQPQTVHVNSIPSERVTITEEIRGPTSSQYGGVYSSQNPNGGEIVHSTVQHYQQPHVQHHPNVVFNYSTNPDDRVTVTEVIRKEGANQIGGVYTAQKGH